MFSLRCEGRTYLKKDGKEGNGFVEALLKKTDASIRHYSAR